jgi:hypothetical protein
MGLLAAENISKGTRHNLWGINTDYEEYAEKSAITATGLQKECDSATALVFGMREDLRHQRQRTIASMLE